MKVENNKDGHNLNFMITDAYTVAQRGKMKKIVVSI